MKAVLNRALRLVRRAVDEGRACIHRLEPSPPAGSSLERTFANLLGDMTTGRVPRLRIFVHGAPLTLNPAIQQRLFLIVHEAATNALRHSEATKIEVEVQYLHDALRVVVRDNGCGINPEAFQRRSDLHRGLCGMRDQAEKIGAQFGSRRGVGTEVCVAVPEIARSSIHGRGPSKEVRGHTSS
jgi:signal transduction histidine kinase